jgi:glycosyltransferase involved in cell wall biosynthesis
VLIDDKTAILVPPKDHVGLARALMRVSDNIDKRRRMARAGRTRALDFAWTSIADRVVDYYDELLNESEIGGQYWRSSPTLVGTGNES